MCDNYVVYPTYPSPLIPSPMKANHLLLAATLVVAIASPQVSVSELVGP